jgi:predicted dehydrogenase
VTDARVRVGIVGLGAWGTRAHLPAFAALPDVDVVALVDPDEAAAQRAAAAYGIARVETDAARLLSAPDGLDAVVIATPDDTHHALALAAFDAGLHVLCEKPLANTLAAATEMLAAAERAGRVARMGFLFRHSPVASRMHELVTQGLIGDVQLFEHVNVNAQFADPQRPLHWKMQRHRANGGVFVEYGAHTIDLALWFGGPLTRVVAHGVTLIAERPLAGGGTAPVDGDDAAAWIGVYANGGQALFRSGWASLPVGAGGMRVYGSRGTLFWEQRGRDSEALLLATHDDPEPRTLLEFTPHESSGETGPFPLGIYSHYNQRLVEGFVHDIRYRGVTGATFADGLAAQRVLTAMRVSLDEERWVDVTGQPVDGSEKVSVSR